MTINETWLSHLHTGFETCLSHGRRCVKPTSQIKICGHHFGKGERCYELRFTVRAELHEQERERSLTVWHGMAWHGYTTRNSGTKKYNRIMNKPVWYGDTPSNHD